MRVLGDLTLASSVLAYLSPGPKLNFRYCAVLIGRCQARGHLASGRQAAGRVKRAVTVSGHDFFRPDSTR